MASFLHGRVTVHVRLVRTLTRHAGGANAFGAWTARAMPSRRAVGGGANVQPTWRASLDGQRNMSTYRQDGELAGRLDSLLRELESAKPSVDVLARTSNRVAQLSSGGGYIEPNERERGAAALAEAASRCVPLLAAASAGELSAVVQASASCADFRASAFDDAALALCAQRGTRELSPNNLGALANATARVLQQQRRAPRTWAREPTWSDGPEGADCTGSSTGEQLLAAIGRELCARHEAFAPADAARVAWALAVTASAAAARPSAGSHGESAFAARGGDSRPSAPRPFAVASSAAFGALAEAVLHRPEEFARETQVGAPSALSRHPSQGRAGVELASRVLAACSAGLLCFLAKRSRLRLGP